MSSGSAIEEVLQPAVSQKSLQMQYLCAGHSLGIGLRSKTGVLDRGEAAGVVGQVPSHDLVTICPFSASRKASHAAQERRSPDNRPTGGRGAAFGPTSVLTCHLTQADRSAPQEVGIQGSEGAVPPARHLTASPGPTRCIFQQKPTHHKSKRENENNA